MIPIEKGKRIVKSSKELNFKFYQSSKEHKFLILSLLFPKNILGQLYSFTKSKYR